MNYIPCSFINSLDKPIRYGPWEGVFVKEENKELSLYALRQHFYKHPEAPKDAQLTVLKSEFIMSVREGDLSFPEIYLLLQAQKSVLKIVEKISI